MTSAESFAAVLSAQPFGGGDVIVLLTGDGLTRVDTAAQLYAMGYAPRILVSGGVDDPPFAIGAANVRRRLIELGVPPDVIDIDDVSQHTADSAREVVAWAVQHGWSRLILVTSAYHMPRAFLSFVAALDAAGLDKIMRVIPCRVAQPWWEAPDGEILTRYGLAYSESEKVEIYQDSDDVAWYASGLRYLRYWERSA